MQNYVVKYNERIASCAVSYAVCDDLKLGCCSWCSSLLVRAP